MTHAGFVSRSDGSEVAKVIGSGEGKLVRNLCYSRGKCNKFIEINLETSAKLKRKRETEASILSLTVTDRSVIKHFIKTS